MLLILGHLDRCVAGSVAYDILESCEEETSSPSPAIREFRHKFRLQSLSTVTQQIPIDFHAPAIVKKVRKKISNIQHQVAGSLRSSSAQQTGELMTYYTSPGYYKQLLFNLIAS